MPKAKPIALIVNPYARGGFIKKHWTSLEKVLQQSLHPEWVFFTQGMGDGRRCAETALQEGALHLIAMGGDGTASEVASGMIASMAAFRKESKPVPEFSFLSLGTGGDLRRTYQTPRSLKEALLSIQNHPPQLVDGGRIDYIDPSGRESQRYFINVASAGIGGLVDQFVNRSSKRWGGKATYLLETLRATLIYKNVPVRIQVDHAEPFETCVYNVAICNGRFFGGGMHIAPMAKVDDGFFDVVLHGDLSLFEIISMAYPLYRGTHLSKPKVFAQKARTLSITPIDPKHKVWLDVDGESVGCLPATFTVLPHALTLRI